MGGYGRIWGDMEGYGAAHGPHIPPYPPHILPYPHLITPYHFGKLHFGANLLFIFLLTLYFSVLIYIYIYIYIYEHIYIYTRFAYEAIRLHPELREAICLELVERILQGRL